MACPSCGSWAVRADRSLGGRMVCARCGCALGIGQRAVPRRPAGRFRLALAPRDRLLLAFGLLLAVSAGLAALSERGSTPGEPRLIPDRSWRSDGGLPTGLAGAAEMWPSADKTDPQAVASQNIDAIHASRAAR